MRTVTVICDLQFGSTGKGLIAGKWAGIFRPDTVVSAWGPNAGHTFIDRDGRKFVHCMIPNGIVSPDLKQVLIGPGSVIDADLLLREYESCRDLIDGRARLMIHPQAVVVQDEHRDVEKEFVTIGSTMKGTGAAMIERIRRGHDHLLARRTAKLREFVCTPREYETALEDANVILVEGAQGYSLSIYHGFYPYTTSRDCTPAQMLADCGIPARWLTRVIGTIRTFPIRVANRFDEDGRQIGTSGPCYEDQRELEWSEIGQSPELTTVTRLPRRLFTFSDMQFRRAFFQCAPDEIFINFLNYLSDSEAAEFVDRIEAITGPRRVRWLGYGPTEKNVIGVF